MEEPPKILDYATPKPAARPSMFDMVLGILGGTFMIVVGGAFARETTVAICSELSYEDNILKLWIFLPGVFASLAFLLAGTSRVLATVRNLRRIPPGR